MMQNSWNDIEMRSARMVINPFSSKDAEQIFDSITPTLTRFMPWVLPASKKDFPRFGSHSCKPGKTGIISVLLSETASAGVFSGWLQSIKHLTKKPESGIWIREDFYRHRYG